MNIFYYNPTTMEYSAKGTADESPLEPGVFLIPAYTTNIEPPTFDPETQICRFINGEWELGVVIQPEPVAIEYLKAAKLAGLANRRFSVETGGIIVDGINIKTDRESQATLTGAWVQVQINPAILIDWKGTDGWVQIDKATVEALAGAVGTHVQQCFSRERVYSTAIMALETVEEVEAFDITTGWPDYEAN